MRMIAYYRVSTARQGVSGLGLDAQREAVERYARQSGGELIGDGFVEVESGRKNDRPQLAAALAGCKLHRAKLIVAKLDRLARNVAFVSALMESGVEFTAVDFPQANRLTVHILAAVAEHEREMISARTRDALKAAKERGRVLGGWRHGPVPNDAQRRAAAAALAAAAGERAERLRSAVAELRAAGIVRPSAVAEALNAREITTDRGGSWSTTQASRLLARLTPPKPARRSK